MVNWVLSKLIHVSLSSVHGSAVGSTLYLVKKKNLHALSKLTNIFKYAIFKYADVTKLMLSSMRIIYCHRCFDAVGWAAGRASGL